MLLPTALSCCLLSCLVIPKIFLLLFISCHGIISCLVVYSLVLPLSLFCCLLLCLVVHPIALLLLSCLFCCCVAVSSSCLVVACLLVLLLPWFAHFAANSFQTQSALYWIVHWPGAAGINESRFIRVAQLLLLTWLFHEASPPSFHQHSSSCQCCHSPSFLFALVYSPLFSCGEMMNEITAPLSHVHLD